MRISTLFLQMVVVLTGIVALGLMLWEPQIEGRNAHATLFQIYFHDPFLAYAYIASIPFFAGLTQAFQLLAYARRNKMFSQAGVNALRTIKFCAMASIAFVALGELFILFTPSDDRAGGAFIGLLFVFGASVVVAAAAMLERIVRDAMPHTVRTG